MNGLGRLLGCNRCMVLCSFVVCFGCLENVIYVFVVCSVSWLCNKVWGIFWCFNIKCRWFNVVFDKNVIFLRVLMCVEVI